jgi:DNA-binding MurR/RpiR family transcriptional regulator
MHASLDVNTEELLEAVTLLRHARRIITGIGASGLVARNFSWKLMKIGINAVSEQDMRCCGTGDVPGRSAAGHLLLR